MTGRIKGAATLAMLAALLIMGCSRAVKKSDLTGRYVAKYPFGTDRISLKANGEYAQEFTPKTGNKVATTKGRWSYDQATGYVTFENCLIVYDDHWKLAPDYDVPRNGLCVLPARKLFRTTIVINDDLGWEYVKEDAGKSNP